MKARARSDARSARTAPRDDADAGLAALVARWPGPAAYIAVDGEILCANSGAPPLLAALAERSGDLANAVGHGAGRAPVPIALTHAVGPTIFETTIVPVGAGALVTARDVSLSSNVRTALVESRRRYKDLVEISSDFVWETDRDGRFVFVSPRGALGYAAAELLGREAVSLLAEPDPADAGRASPFATERRIEAEEIWLHGADGAAVRVAISALPLRDAAGGFAGARGLCRDVSAEFNRAAARAEAQHHERLLAYIMRAMRDEVEAESMLTAAATAIARAAGAAGSAIFRYDGTFARAAGFGVAPPDVDIKAEMLPRLAADGVADALADAMNGAVRLLSARTSYRGAANGALILWRGTDAADWNESERALVADAAGQLGIALAQLAQHEMLARLATTDPLTGLLNRRAFVDELARRLASAQRRRRGGALLYVDLDNFKLLNDHHGHQRGDEALKLVAAHLKERSRVYDLPARLGGDEFALWLDDVDAAGALAKAETVRALDASLAALSEGLPRPLSLSIGIAVHAADDAEREEALIARADEAMYRVKHGGKGAIAIASPPQPGPA